MEVSLSLEFANTSEEMMVVYERSSLKYTGFIRSINNSSVVVSVNLECTSSLTSQISTWDRNVQSRGIYPNLVFSVLHQNKN